MRKLKYTVLLLVGLVLPHLLAGQEGPAKGGKDKITIIRAQKTNVKEVPVKLTTLTGDVILRQDSALFYADTVIMQGQFLQARGNIVIRHGDSTSVFGDSLAYDGSTREADLVGEVVLVNGEQQLFTDYLSYDLRTHIARYTSGAMLTDRESYLSSKQGYYNTKNNIAFFRDSVRVAHPSFKLRSDSMYYDTRSDRTRFVAPTRIKQEGADIYAEGGYFNLKSRNALFTNNAQYSSGKTSAVADSIYYDDRTSTVLLSGNARYLEGELAASANRILYNEKTGDAVLAGKAEFQDSIRRGTADTIFFNTETEFFQTKGKTWLREGTRTVRAGSISRVEGTRLSRLEGNVLFQDSSAAITLRSPVAFSDDSSGYLKAFGDSTFLITELDGDSLYLSADSIERVVWPDSVGGEILKAWYNVRIYNSDLQGVCDSFVYYARDSIFRMFGNPLLWSDTSQYMADTILVQLNNGRIDKVYLRGNALIINSPDALFYNQVKGKNITAYFVDGGIDRVFVDGNAVSVYYVLDEVKAYIGVNKVESSSIWMYFEGSDVTNVRFYNLPEGTFLPMDEADHEALKLDGFKWYSDIRPLSVSQIFENP